MYVYDEPCDVGDLVTLGITFTAAGVPTNPTTVVLTIKMPDGTTSTPAPTNGSLGMYDYDLLLSASGVWLYRWAGSGAVQVAEEGQLYVRVSKVLV